MSAKTKIIVLHMKEVIYTGIFLLLAVILAIVLFFMFGSGQKKVPQPMPKACTNREFILPPST